ncbi:MAG: GAF domain-containing protein [Bacteroidota bacterium]
MNIGLYKRPKVGTILTTIYFGGVLISASAMYMKEVEALYEVLGVTFFSGILAIYFTARSKEEIVVYLEKKEQATAEEKMSHDSSQLNDVILTGDPQQVLNEICEKLGAGQGAIYVLNETELKLTYGYAIGNHTASFKLGEGLVGRVAAEGERLYLNKLPDNYITVFSGLGNSSPKYLALIPIKNGVIEIATFNEINDSTLKHIETSCTEVLK